MDLATTTRETRTTTELSESKRKSRPNGRLFFTFDKPYPLAYFLDACRQFSRRNNAIDQVQCGFDPRDVADPHAGARIQSGITVDHALHDRAFTRPRTNF